MLMDYEKVEKLHKWLEETCATWPELLYCLKIEYRDNKAVVHAFVFDKEDMERDNLFEYTGDMTDLEFGKDNAMYQTKLEQVLI